MVILLRCDLRLWVYYPCGPSLLLAGSRLGWPKSPSLLHSASTVACNFSEGVSVFFKANETSWTISSFFPRSKDLHKGGGGEQRKSLLSTAEESADPARGTGTQSPTPQQMADARAH